ncbi:MAG: hypothetical protein K6F85_01020 [Bacteroidales bacterium]|nr:hypothetical protein [Bacteroidales bacterium]
MTTAHFRKYYACLAALTALAVLASFVVLWVSPSNFHTILPLTALYFAVVTGLEHWFIINSAQKDPRTFIKNFLGITVGVLFLHLVVMAVYLFTHTSVARIFIVGFCVGYIAYLVFETVALVLFVRNRRKEADQ